MNSFPQSVQWAFSHIFPSFLYTYAWLALHCCYDEWVKIKAILNCLFIRSCCFEPQKHFGCQSYYCEVVHQNQSVWSCHRQSAIMTLLFRFSTTSYLHICCVCWLPSLQSQKSLRINYYRPGQASVQLSLEAQCGFRTFNHSELTWNQFLGW